jgi:hypothetical protein
LIDSPRQLRSRLIPTRIDRILDLRRVVQPERPPEVLHKRWVDRRVVERQEACAGDDLEKVDDVDDPPLPWTAAPRDKAGLGRELRVVPAEVPGGMEPRDEEGKEGEAGSGPEDGGLLGCVTIGKGRLEAGDEISRINVVEADLDDGREVRDGPGDGRKSADDVCWDGEKRSAWKRRGQENRLSSTAEG